LRIPVAPTGNGEYLPAFDHFRLRETFVPNPHGFVQPRVPYRIGDDDPAPLRPAARLGEHTGQVDWAPRPPGESEPSPELPLAGVRIVDFTAFWAGPAGTHALACLGADVVKIEAIQRPDGMRFTTTQPPTVDQWWEWCPVFLGVNGNKRSVTLDMNRPEGVELVKRLIAGADAVVENFSPRVIEAFGLDWPVVREVNPCAVMVRMPGFGLTGPWRDRTGFAQTMEQASGMAWITGYPDGPPLIPRGPCDPVAGMHAAFALLVALDRRDRTGEGALVELPMVEVALNMAAEQVVECSAYGALLQRDGNRGPFAAPQGVYACAGDERWLALAIATDEQWRGLVQALGEPAWARDQELATAKGRRAAHDRVDDELARWCAARDLDETVDELLANGVPAAPVVRPVDLGRNEQLRARGFWEPVDHPVIGTHEIPGLPFRLAGGPARWTRTHPPTLGQHNGEVLGGELGLSPAELDRLRAADVIGERPLGR